MKRKLLMAALLCLVLVAAFALVAAPAALAAAKFIDYTSTEQLVGFSMSDPVQHGSVQHFGMANHFVDSGATHPWGNFDVYTNSSWVRHTVGGLPTDSTFIGSYRTEGAYGDTEGWFTGWMSWTTGEMYYRFNGTGVSGDLAGTVWRGAASSANFFGEPLHMSARILVP